MSTEPPMDDLMDPRRYATLPLHFARRLREMWRATADPRAATSRGYPYPLRSWPPDAAIDLQNLAEALNDDVGPIDVLATSTADTVNEHTDRFNDLGLNGKRVVSGTAAVSVSGTGGATVVFPAGSFTTAPVVTAALGDESATIKYIAVANAGVTSTQFAVRASLANGSPAASGTIRINYVAVGSPGTLLKADGS